MKLTRLALAVAALSVLQPVVAEEDSLQLGKSIVTGNRLAQEDFVAPYASEVHNFEDIQKSGAISLYDYLGRFSSVNVMPSYGNPYQQLLDMRGYGLENGFQNIVVTLNGRRLNDIDGLPQLLGNISLASIERIEIIKGSGSVAQGDGAMAGVINIVTRDAAGADLSMAAGSDGYLHTSVRAGLVQDKISLQLLADNSSSDGLRKADANGNTDESDADNLSLDLKLQPVDGLELRLGRDQSRIDTAYGSPLSKQDFNNTPKKNSSTTEQEYEVDTNRFGVTYQVNNTVRFNLDHTVEKKDSAYVGSAPSKYDYRATDFSTNLNLGALSLVAGAQMFDGERNKPHTPPPYGSIANETTKKNLGLYLQGQYQLNNTLISAGARHEKVEYEYQDAGQNLKAKENLYAWDLGVNHKLNNELSLFANINRAFQAPDLDRFFNPIYDSSSLSVIGSEFNGFIKPATSTNFNLGFNHLTQSNQLQATLFYSRLKNEIYATDIAGTFTNTNIDKSHKYGLEIQDRYQFNEQLQGRLNYAWTVAKIDRENEGNGKYNGKKLPGVSAHSITAGLDYNVLKNGTLSLTQNWRSRSYTLNDFENNMNKAKAYNTTDFGYSHKIQQFTLFAQVNNLFNKKNGVWVTDNAVYPVNFTRTWHAGARISF